MSSRAASRPVSARRRTGLVGTALAGVLVAGCSVLAAGCSVLADPGPGAREVHWTPRQHPFAAARLTVDRDTQAAAWQTAHQAPWLSAITSRPQTRWLSGPADVSGLAGLLRQSAEQGAVPVVVVYDIPRRDCSGGGAADADAYRAFVASVVTALGSTRAVVVLEPDAVAADCFDAARAALLRDTVATLTVAGEWVYLDAGHPGWRSVGQMRDRLLDAGVDRAEGFSLDVANRQPTADSVAYGTALSAQLGDRGFVVDTSRNGLGAPTGAAVASQAGGGWCNPPDQALGQAPTTATGTAADAYLWVKDPGESDGACGGEGGVAGQFSPRQAAGLIARSPATAPAVRAELTSLRPQLPPAGAAG